MKRNGVLWLIGTAILITWMTAIGRAPADDTPARVFGQGVDSQAGVVGQVQLREDQLQLAEKTSPDRAARARQVRRTESAPPAADAAAGRIQLDVQLLKVAPRSLKEAEIDLLALMHKLDRVSDRQREPFGVRRAVVHSLWDQTVAKAIIHSMKAAGAAKVMSELALVTVDGREAHWHSGGERVLAKIVETTNGRTQQLNQSLQFGTVARLTPRIREAGGLNVDLDVAVLELKKPEANNNPFAISGSSQSPPVVHARRIQSRVQVDWDATALVLEPWPGEDAKDNKADADELLLVTITPRRAATKELSEASSAKRTWATIAVPKPRPAPQEPPPAPKFDRPPVPADPDRRLLKAVRELRTEVRQLRHDTERLRALLEKQGQRQQDKDAHSDDQRPLPLDRPVSLHFDEVPLGEVIERLATTAGVNMVLDNRGLQEEGLTATKPITLHVDDVTLRQALELLLKPLPLAFRIEGNVLKITSRMRALGPLVLKSYPVADLLSSLNATAASGKRLKPSKNNAQLDGNDAGIDLDDLVALITTTVEPDSWQQVGGPGVVQAVPATQTLVVRSAEPVHAQVADLLEQLWQRQRPKTELRTRVFSTDDAHWRELARHEMAGPLLKRLSEQGSLLLNDEQLSALLQAFQQNGLPTAFSYPSLMLATGQPMTIDILPDFPGFGGRSRGLVSPAPSIRFVPTVSDDRRSVLMSVKASGTGMPEPLHRGITTNMADGETLLVDLSTIRSILGSYSINGVPFGEAVVVEIEGPHGARLKANRIRTFQTAGQEAERVFLLVRATIVVEGEQEDLLGLPPR